MATDRGRPLPKFGEWDVNNPSSADGFTVIFSKARDEKKTNSSGAAPTPRRNSSAYQKKTDNTKIKPSATKKSWLCCVP